MKRLALAVLLATSVMLAGCFETMPKNQYIAVAEECKQEIPAPTVEMYQPPYDNLHTAVSHLLGDREQLKAENGKLRSRLQACK